MKDNQFIKSVFFTIAAALCSPATANLFIFSGELESVAIDNGESIFSGATQGDSVTGFLNLETLTGHIEINEQSVGEELSCCEIAEGVIYNDDQVIDSETASYYNQMLIASPYSSGDVADVLHVQIEYFRSNGARIQSEVIFVLGEQAFGPNHVYELNDEDIELSFAVVTEELDDVLYFSAHGPVLKDIDDDEIPDYLDNCTFISNPSQIDADLDGFGNPCDADFDNNCVVNFLDIAIYRAAFNSQIGDPNYDPIVDLDSTGVIGFLDLFLLTTAFFSPPGPSNVECGMTIPV